MAIAVSSTVTATAVTAQEWTDLQAWYNLIAAEVTAAGGTRQLKTAQKQVIVTIPSTWAIAGG